MGAPLREWILRTIGAVALVAGTMRIVTWSVAWQIRVALLVIVFGLLVDQAFRRLPAFDPFGRIRWRLPSGARERRWCAVTFDDGPTAATAAVLDILAAEGVPATFFVLGQNVERLPWIVQRAQVEGHAIGLHGTDHSKLAGAGVETVEAQVAGLSSLLRQHGVHPAPLYRTPHGHKSRSVFTVAQRHGLTLWAWTRGVWDTDNPKDPAVLVRRATRLVRSGMVLLLHDGRGDEPSPDVSAMVAALPEILRELKRRRFEFVRLADV